MNRRIGWIPAAVLATLAACAPGPDGTGAPPAFSEEERQAIYKRIVAAEDRGDDEAQRELAANPPSRLADWENRAEEIADRYKSELAAELGLTLEQLEAIAGEGRRNDWDMD